MNNLAILLLALLIDLTCRELPQAIHPVVWMGKLVSLLDRAAPARGRLAQMIYGSITTLFTILIFTSPVYFLLRYMSEVSPLAYIISGALLLKPTFAFRKLRHTALEVETLLAKNSLTEARAMMPALVSRETQDLGRAAMISATVESVAENFSDSFVAPLFYFLFLGVPGALAYRVVNTCDAMIGYHGKYEYLGKFTARLDDVLNFIPARISALLLTVTACWHSRNGRNAWRIMLRDHNNTESPNAGWPMSAIAGALMVRLEKASCYSLGTPDNPLSPQLITTGLRLAGQSVALWVLLCSAVEVTYFAFIA